MTEFLVKRPWISVLIGFVLTFLLVKINPIGIDLSSWIFGIYLLPITLFSIYVLTSPVFGAKSITPNEKRAIVYEQIYSILRKVLTILGAIIALGVFDKVPLIGSLNNALIYLAENWDMSIDAIEKIVGLLLGLIGQFSNNSRFEVRALVNPRKIDL